MKLNYTGNAEINSYFESVIDEKFKNEKILKASFRGRKFNGKEIHLNKNNDFNDYNESDLSAIKAKFFFDKNSEMNVEKFEEIDKIYHWKFDEGFNKNCFDINKMVKDLNKFK